MLKDLFLGFSKDRAQVTNSIIEAEIVAATDDGWLDRSFDEMTQKNEIPVRLATSWYKSYSKYVELLTQV